MIQFPYKMVPFPYRTFVDFGMANESSPLPSQVPLFRLSWTPFLQRLLAYLSEVFMKQTVSFIGLKKQRDTLHEKFGQSVTFIENVSNQTRTKTCMQCNML